MGDLRARLALLTRSISFGWILIPKSWYAMSRTSWHRFSLRLYGGNPRPSILSVLRNMWLAKKWWWSTKSLLPEIVSSLDGAQPGFQRKVLSCQHTDVVLVLGAHGGVLHHLRVCPAEDVKTVRGSHWLTGDRGGRAHLKMDISKLGWVLRTWT